MQPRTRVGAGRLAAIAFLALGGCAAQQTAGFEPPRFIAEAAQAHHDLRFLPGSAQISSGEQQELAGFLRALVLRPNDDIVLHFASSGSTVLDRQRVTAAERAVAQVGTPARVRIDDPRGFGRSGGGGDVVLVQAHRFDRVLVDCRPAGVDEFDPGFPASLPRVGCANAVNLANMAASVRDLTDPRILGPADSTVSAAAVARYRAGQVIPARSLSGM